MRRPFVVIALIAISSVAVCRADTLDEARAKYLNKPLLLRGFHTAEKLFYDSEGKLTAGGGSGSWTTGYVQISKISLTVEHGFPTLVLQGKHLGVVFDRKTQARRFKEWTEVKIHVLFREPPDSSAVARALERVFLPGEVDVATLAEPCWQGFLSGRVKSDKESYSVEEPPSATAHPEMPLRVGGEVRPPKALAQLEPTYSKPAKKAGIQGSVVYAAVIDASGTLRDIQIVRPLGFGLDERGCATLGSWKFEPALRQGRPVPVLVNIDVNFELWY